jgi:glycosyltransferase involved in cell wall biosynthesis
MRVKILDAWARGIPIVSTTIGCEGIEVQPEQNILIADTPSTFADAVLRVIRDPALGQRMAENGRRWVEQKYNWRVVYKKLDSIYSTASGQAPRKVPGSNQVAPPGDHTTPEMIGHSII